MPITINIGGLKELQASLNKTITQAAGETHDAVLKFAKGVESDAKRNAPADEGFLRNSITGTVSGQNTGGSASYTATITASANYAAYLEFGTRKFAAEYVATLPNDWATYAATFKGSGGGNFDNFVIVLTEWVKRKGLHLTTPIQDAQTGQSFNAPARKSKKQKESDANQLAYVIARSIMINGIHAQPFLYPATVKHTPALINDIKKIFE